MHSNYETRLQLMDAIKEGNLIKIRNLVGFNIGLLVEPLNTHEFTALHFAAKLNQVGVMDYILEELATASGKTKAEILNSYPNNRGITPIHSAAVGGSIDALSYIIENGGAINAPDKDGRTPLHCAIKGKNGRVVELLLNHGANLLAVNHNGMRPDQLRNKVEVNVLRKKIQRLYSAIRSGDLKVVREYSEQNIRWLLLPLDGYGNKALHVAAGSNQVEVLKFILEKIDEASANTKTQILNISRAHITNARPLHNAVAAGSLEAAIYLLEQGADIEATVFRQYTSLHLAVFNQHDKLTNLLVTHNANLLARDSFNKTPDQIIPTKKKNKRIPNVNFLKVQKERLISAINRGDFRTVKQYAEQNTYWLKLPLKKNQVAMHMAAKSNKIEILKYIVNSECQYDREGMSPTLTKLDGYGLSPMHYLALMGKKAEYNEMSNFIKRKKGVGYDTFETSKKEAIERLCKSKFSLLVSVLPAAPHLLQHFKIDKYFAKRIENCDQLILFIKTKPKLGDFLLSKNRIKKLIIRETKKNPDTLAKIIATLPMGALRNQERAIRKIICKARYTKRDRVTSRVSSGLSFLAKIIRSRKLSKKAMEYRKKVEAINKHYITTFIRETFKSPSQYKLKNGEIMLLGLFHQPQDNNGAAQYFRSVDQNDPINYIHAQHQLAAMNIAKFSDAYSEDNNSRFADVYKNEAVKACENIVDTADDYLKTHPNNVRVKEFRDAAKSISPDLSIPKNAPLNPTATVTILVKSPEPKKKSRPESIKLSKSKNTLWARKPLKTLPVEKDANPSLLKSHLVAQSV